jgi:hypothetical protein
MEFLVRWTDYTSKDDSYISWHAAEHLEELDKYMRKKADIFREVFGDVARTGVAVWAKLLPEEAELVDTFLARNKTEKTWKDHLKHWGVWIQFLRLEDREARWGVCLEKCSSCDEKVQAVIFYMAWLSAHPRSYRGEEIFRPCRALRAMISRYGGDTQWFEDYRLKEARKAARHTNEEFRNKGREGLIMNRAFLPLTFDMIDATRDETWGEDVWDRECLDKRGVDLAMRVGLDSGFRPGHLGSTSTKDTNSDHRIILADVGLMDEMDVKQSWSKFPQSHFDEKCNREKIKELKVDVWTSKSGRARQVGNEVKRLGRNSPQEAKLMDDLLLWWSKAGTRENDPIFTRYDPKRKNRRRELQGSDIRAGIKNVAATHNLPVDSYSGRSMRVGFATASMKMGIKEETMKARGGWSKNSNVPKKHYDKGQESGGLLAWSEEGELLSVEHVKKMI